MSEEPLPPWRELKPPAGVGQDRLLDHWKLVIKVFFDRVASYKAERRGLATLLSYFREQWRPLIEWDDGGPWSLSFRLFELYARAALEDGPGTAPLGGDDLERAMCAEAARRIDGTAAPAIVSFDVPAAWFNEESGKGEILKLHVEAMAPVDPAAPLVFPDPEFALSTPMDGEFYKAMQKAARQAVAAAGSKARLSVQWSVRTLAQGYFPVEPLGGPSVSGALARAAYHATTGRYPDVGVLVTAAVGDDGALGKVKKVREKTLAALEANHPSQFERPIDTIVVATRDNVEEALKACKDSPHRNDAPVICEEKTFAVVVAIRSRDVKERRDYLESLCRISPDDTPSQEVHLTRDGKPLDISALVPLCISSPSRTRIIVKPLGGHEVQASMVIDRLASLLAASALKQINEGMDEHGHALAAHHVELPMPMEMESLYLRTREHKEVKDEVVARIRELNGTSQELVESAVSSRRYRLLIQSWDKANQRVAHNVNDWLTTGSSAPQVVVIVAAKHMTHLVADPAKVATITIALSAATSVMPLRSKPKPGRTLLWQIASLSVALWLTFAIAARASSLMHRSPEQMASHPNAGAQTLAITVPSNAGAGAAPLKTVVTHEQRPGKKPRRVPRVVANPPIKENNGPPCEKECDPIGFKGKQCLSWLALLGKYPGCDDGAPARSDSGSP